MLRPFIIHQFNSTIWRLEIDSRGDSICIETRDQSDKKVYFSSISLRDGQVYFEDLETEERWLTGIEAVCDGVLLLHNYQSESGPSHKAIIALDAHTGNRLWNDFNSAFDHLSINGPVCYDVRFQPRKLMLTDIKTGAMLRKYEPAIDLEIPNYQEFPESASDDILTPISLPVKPLENTIQYLEHNSYRIVSLHAIAEGALQQQLYIVRDGNMVFNDLLNTDIQKLQPESFLIYQDHLIYLKNRSQLIVLNL